MALTGLEEVPDRCPRCSGTVVHTQIVGENGQWIPDDYCLYCGERFGFDPPTDEQRKHTRKLKWSSGKTWSRKAVT